RKPGTRLLEEARHAPEDVETDRVVRRGAPGVPPHLQKRIAILLGDIGMTPTGGTSGHKCMDAGRGLKPTRTPPAGPRGRTGQMPDSPLAHQTTAFVTRTRTKSIHCPSFSRSRQRPAGHAARPAGGNRRLAGPSGVSAFPASPDGTRSATIPACRLPCPFVLL